MKISSVKIRAHGGLLFNRNTREDFSTRKRVLLFSLSKSLDKKKMVFLTIESANKAEINILSARDTTRPGL